MFSFIWSFEKECCVYSVVSKRTFAKIVVQV